MADTAGKDDSQQPDKEVTEQDSSNADQVKDTTAAQASNGESSEQPSTEASGPSAKEQSGPSATEQAESSGEPKQEVGDERASSAQTEPEASGSTGQAQALPEKKGYQDQEALMAASAGGAVAAASAAPGISVMSVTHTGGEPPHQHPAPSTSFPPTDPPPSYLAANALDDVKPPDLVHAEPVGPLPMDKAVAPPPYMAAQQAQPQCQLSYADFMPACVGTKPDNSPAFQQFGELMQQANNWLQQNPHLQPVTCETVERKVENVSQSFTRTKAQLIDIQTMGVSEQTFDEVNTYVKGFRLWVCSRLDMSTPPPQLGYFDVTPDRLADESSAGSKIGDRKFYPGFEEMSMVMAKLNSYLHQKPIPGSVFNLQTIELRVGAKAFSDTLIATDETCHTTQPHQTQMTYRFVRVFYIQGAPTQPSIGYKDFLPKVLARVASRDKTQDPKFERMSALHQTVQNWIMSNPAIQLLNVQTLDTRNCSWAWLDNEGYPRVNPEHMDREQAEINRWDRILRFSRCYFLHGNQGAYPGPPGHTGSIIMHTWPPETLGRTFEGLTPTTQRMQNFLASNPGCRVLCAETIKLDYRSGGAHKSECDRVFSRLDKAKSLYFFYAIRVYVTSPTMVMQRPAAVSSSACVLL